MQIESYIVRFSSNIGFSVACAPATVVLYYLQGGEHMIELFVSLSIVAFLLIAVFIKKSGAFKQRYDHRGFDHNKIHKNGTKYDDRGFDYWGYDADGYDQYGYNRFGKNRKGQYDRFQDPSSCEEEGFYNPRIYPPENAYRSGLESRIPKKCNSKLRRRIDLEKANARSRKLLRIWLKILNNGTMVESS